MTTPWFRMLVKREFIQSPRRPPFLKMAKMPASQKIIKILARHRRITKLRSERTQKCGDVSLALKTFFALGVFGYLKDVTILKDPGGKEKSQNLGTSKIGDSV